MEPLAQAPSLPRTVEEIRAEFPILATEQDGEPLAYLDNAASAQKPEAVLRAMDSLYRHDYANIHRGVYRLSERATELFESARRTVADWIGATFEEVVFTRNATEAINLVAHSWGRANVGPGDVIALTEMEHHSNIVPWQLLAAERGAELAWIAVTEDGAIDSESLDRALDRAPRLLALAHVSNVLGTVNPVAEIVARAHDAGAVVLVDAAQAAPQVRFSVVETGADFTAFTGHKLYGPTGAGVLVGRRELLEEMPPFLGGGDMIKKVDFESSTWNRLPWKFEAGTSAFVEAVGLGAAVTWLTELGLEAVRAHEVDLTDHALGRLAEVPGLRIHGPPRAEDRGALVSFDIEGIHPHDIAEILDRRAICVRAGHHCAQPLLSRLGVAATARASFGVYNTREEVDRLVDGLHECRRVFKLD